MAAPLSVLPFLYYQISDKYKLFHYFGGIKQTQLNHDYRSRNAYAPLSEEVCGVEGEY